MGVPKFYRWLSERYVSVNHVISDLSLLPEFDNLYLDMNGIIHACTHPNDQEISQGLSQEEMMKNIWNYVDRIVTQIVKPQKLLYVAVDGVAPRAKMNQQRSRRFRAAKDAREMREEAQRKGVVVDEESVFDSNCITPGTEFMAVVDAHLQYFIRKKMKEDPLWRRLTIIYSGHGVPGEGEHKIMQYIRDMKASPAYQPNLRHCMYGQDADLIMLALATHEPHFTLLREVIDFGRGRGGGGANALKTVLKQTKDASFQLLHLSILREYLEYEFLRDVPEEFREAHLERVVDDFVFLTFLVGNDFLPHLPSLDISEHAFDRLFEIYGTHFRRWGGQGYLTNRGEIDPERLQAFFEDIGRMEDDIFDARAEEVQQFNARRRRNAKRFGSSQPVPSEEELAEEEAQAQSAYEQALLAAVRKGEMTAERAREIMTYTGSSSSSNGNGHEAAAANGNGDGGAVKKKNFRGRYYYEKLGVLDPENSEKVRHLCQTYAEGLAWCLAYYVKGCVSWQWFYPYHYGPLIADVKELGRVLSSLKFEIGEPFRPFEQLLGCLPAASAKFLPRKYQFLMTSPTSPIIDFYPEDFKVDMNGKHNPWEGVVLIPFIDEARLFRAIKDHCPETSLTSEEKRRNSFGKILTFRHAPALSVTVPSCNPAVFPDITQCQTSVTPSSYSKESLTSFEPRLVPGTVIPSPGFPSLKVLPISEVRIEAIRVNIHGTESRYRSICLSLPVAELPAIHTLAPEILGRPVYVNWPMMHEARITAVTDGEVEHRLDPLLEVGSAAAAADALPTVTRALSAEEKAAWEETVEAQQKAYLYGRGVVGLGGVEVGSVTMMLKVRPLQGLERCPRTGATRKVFGTHEAEVPIQMAMWSVPTADPRFIETGPVAIDDRVPLGGDVVFLEGKHRGLTGRVVGYGTKGPHGESVKVEVVAPAEPDKPIGLLARKALGRRYYDAREVMKALSIDGRVLGKVTGSLFVDPGKFDLGLNLKIRGKYVLPDYVRRKPAANAEGAAAWAATVDVVRIVGSAEAGDGAGGDEPGGVPWEYSEKAVLLIRAYMEAFPNLFKYLRSWPNEVAYNAQQVFGANHAAELERVRSWLAAQETAVMPRVPLTTQVLPREAIRAIERAADELAARRKRAAGGRVEVRVVEVPPEELLAAGSHRPSDLPRRLAGRPELGDRVVNLHGLGVPFGLRGTVVALHKHSACVEVLFDEEFIGGTSLQGTCSPYRGKLLPWSALLKTTADVSAAVAAAGATGGAASTAAGKGGDRKGDRKKGSSGGGGGGAVPAEQPTQSQTQALLSLLGAARNVSAAPPAPGAVQIMGRPQQPQQQAQQQAAPSASPAQEAGKSLLAALKGGLGLGGSSSARKIEVTSGSGGSSSGRSQNQQASASTVTLPADSISARRKAAAAAAGTGGGEASAAASSSADGGGGGGKASSQAGHRQAKGPADTGGPGFQLKRSRARAPTAAEMVAAQEAEAKAREAQDMARVMSLLTVKDKAQGQAQQQAGAGGGDASSSLKSMLRINGASEQQPQPQQPPAAMAMNPPHPPPYGYPPPPPPQGFHGGGGPMPHPPPHPYYFPPSMPRGMMPPMMMPYYGGGPQPGGGGGGMPVARRVSRARSGGEGAGAGGEGGQSGGGKSFIMPSQVLRVAKKVPVASGGAGGASGSGEQQKEQESPSS